MTMKLETFNDPKPEAAPPVFLRLENSGKDINVVVVDAKGVVVPGGYLLKFKEDGHLYLHSSVSEGFGFTLTKYGEIKIR